ncbi:hypothetical protein ACN20G_03890 [Streptomyces sp. BI20]|uniref:hypothetical protein n=1 Tax=Streptomyces sp. BI20 TaxID=3403460 RepID=UPI003C733814
MTELWRELAHPLLGKTVVDSLSGRVGVLKVVMTEAEVKPYTPTRYVAKAHVRMSSGYEFMTLPEYLSEGEPVAEEPGRFCRRCDRPIRAGERGDTIHPDSMSGAEPPVHLHRGPCPTGD